MPVSCAAHLATHVGISLSCVCAKNYPYFIKIHINPGTLSHIYPFWMGLSLQIFSNFAPFPTETATAPSLTSVYLINVQFVFPTRSLLRILNYTGPRTEPKISPFINQTRANDRKERVLFVVIII